MKIIRFFAIFLLIIGISVGIFVIAVSIFGKGTTVTVPNLIGKNIKDISNKSFVIVNVKEYNMKFPKGTIISQEPLPNSTMKKGHPIVVNLSLGPKVETLPDFSNNLLQQAKLKITSLNFKVGKILYMPLDKPSGTVVAQNPQAGTIYKEGEPVSLLVSTGKSKETLIVKNLIGKDSKNVIKTFKDMNLKVKISKEYSLKYPVNSILNQYPRAGMILGNSLNLTINSISQYQCFVYINYPYSGTIKIEKYISNSLVYSKKSKYGSMYMDYFFDYRPFTIKVYVNGILVKEQNSVLIK